MEPPMTVKELSDYLRLDRMTIYKMLKEGSIPASRIGHQWRFFRDDIDKWIRSKRIGHATLILVVDTDSSITRLFESELSPEGYEVTVVSGGDEAQSALTNDAFDIAFMELRRNTLDVFSKIRSANSDALVVIAADTSESRLVDQAMDIGAFTLVRKPSSGDQLRNMLSGLPLTRSAAV